MTAALNIPKVLFSQDDFSETDNYPAFLPYRQFNNFVMIPAGMVAQQDIPPSAVTLYGCLLKYSGKDGLCYPSQQTLADDLGICTRQVRNLITILENHNYIRRKTSEGKYSRTYYIFLVNRVIAEDLKQHPDKKVKKQNLKVSDGDGSQCLHFSPTVTLDCDQSIKVTLDAQSPDTQSPDAQSPDAQSPDTQSKKQPEMDFRSHRKAISAATIYIKKEEKRLSNPRSTSRFHSHLGTPGRQGP